MTELIAQGAEAKLFRDGTKLTKERVSKSYRIPAIDERLRAFRTRREAKILDRLRGLNFPAPLLRNFCDKSMKIDMDFLQGSKLKDVFNKRPVELAREIGKKVGKLHANGIIHADLTTSNMILMDGKHGGKENTLNNIHFIDFGLSFFSEKVEDKAVDLHLLDRALESAHYDVYEGCISAVFDGYRESYPDAENVLNRLEKVQQRGRNKGK